MLLSRSSLIDGMESDYHQQRSPDGIPSDFTQSPSVDTLLGSGHLVPDPKVSPGDEFLPSSRQSFHAGKSQEHSILPVIDPQFMGAILKLEKPCQGVPNYTLFKRGNPSFFSYSTSCNGHKSALEVMKIDEELQKRCDASYSFLTPRFLERYGIMEHSSREMNVVNELNQYIMHAKNILKEEKVFRIEQEIPFVSIGNTGPSLLSSTRISERKYLPESDQSPEIRSLVGATIGDPSTSDGAESQVPQDRIIGLLENEKLDLVEHDERNFCNRSRVIEPSSEELLERNAMRAKLDVEEILPDAGVFDCKRADRIGHHEQNLTGEPLPNMMSKPEINYIPPTTQSDSPTEQPSPRLHCHLQSSPTHHRAHQNQQQHLYGSSLSYSLTKRKAPSSQTEKVRVLHFESQNKKIFNLKQFWLLSLPLLLLSALPFSAGEANPEAYPGPDPGPAKQWKAIGDIIPETDYEDSYTENKPKCDRQYISGSQKEGVFRAPDLYNPDQISRQCLYTFIAGEGERVQLQFRRFDLRGTPPECSHEYVDIFTEANDPDKDLLKTPFGGRYCGKIPPRLRISWHKTIHIAFFTDKNFTTPDLFAGIYKFINESKYSVGTKAPDQDCGYVIHVDFTKNGEFMSPTYPGVYPKNITCYWKFVGKADQRIRMEFRDFDLFYGGPHCPFDNVKMFDGPDSFSPLVGTYCGQQRNLVVFSSSNSLLVTFSTLYRIADTQNRGFQGIFNISNSYLKLNFIDKTDAEHIRGTECDQRILSKRTSNGTVFSPNYPFLYLPNIVCRYFIYGLQDSQNLERVRLEFFDRFDIPATPKGGKNCSDGYLRIYLRGQEVRSEYDKPDQEYCGKSLPHSVVAYGPRLLMVFSSGSTTGTGFKAHYKFETEYKIPGTASPDGRCIFTYLSTSQKSGTFNSPRHPSNYPSNTTCEFTFKPLPDEVVEIGFITFKIRADNPGTGPGTTRCQEDWMELYNIYKPRNSNTAREILNGRYCGETSPGPTQSERDAVGLRVVLNTDHEGVYSGFDAIYMFKKKEDTFGICGGNFTNMESGVILSPSFPENYGAPSKTDPTYCDWFIQVRPNHKILLWFESFAVEGNPDDRGCSAAAVRVWKDADDMPVDMCGEALPSDQVQILSKGPTLRMNFLAAARAVGAKGFKAIWTEIQDSRTAGPQCNQFLCKASNYCISRSLRCDSIGNCGLSDFSDEERCDKASEVNVLMLVGAVLGISSVLAIVVCIWCQRKRAQKRKESSLAHHVHVYERGARFASMDSVDRSVSPVVGARKAQHHLSHASLRTETVV